MVVITAVLWTWAAWLGTAQAEPISFKVPLSGGQEVPPVFPAGAGMADLTYDPATRVLTWTVTYRALSSPVTMAAVPWSRTARQECSIYPVVGQTGESD